MALTQRTKNVLEAGLADKKAALEVSTAMDAQSAKVAAAVAAIASPGSATTTDIANKVNAVIAALKAAGLMST